jgi:hypothetical protein
MRSLVMTGAVAESVVRTRIDASMRRGSLVKFTDTFFLHFPMASNSKLGL